MRINKQNIIASFQGYDTRVIDFLSYVIEDLKQLGIKINNYTLIVFQLLATQLTIYFKSLDCIKSVTNITNENNRTIPELNTLNKAHAEILRLLDKIGLSPLERAKIDKLNQNTTTKEEAAEDTLLRITA